MSALLVCSLTIAGFAGCGHPDRLPVFPVRGGVFHQGAPTEGALVIFTPVFESEFEAVRPHGRVAGDGSFQLTTYERNDGAPAGEYAVTFFWPKRSTSPVADPDSGPDQLQNRYNDPEKSSFRVRVEETDNAIAPFQLP